jgi:membrane-bound ClpP family serine protease
MDQPAPITTTATSAAPASPAPAAEPVGGHLFLLVVLTLALMLAACGLLMTEFVLFSGGVLTIAAAICVVGACAMAFSISSVVGIAAVLACPLLALLVSWLGLRRLRGTPALPTTVIAADSGYHQVAARLGITVGMTGELLADALPAAVARFAGATPPGEIEVMVVGGAQPRGTRVRVVAIDGMAVSVAPVA